MAIPLDARPPALPSGLPRAWLSAYGAICAVTLASATIVALGGLPLTLPVRHVLALKLTPHLTPAPSVEHVLALTAHNMPIVAWPLLLGVTGANRHRLSRRIADGVLLACIIVNTLPVGAALGAYGAPLLPYIPQLPLEWAGFALSASSWLVQRQRALSIREGLLLFGLIACVLLGAATLESFAVPHR